MSYALRRRVWVEVTGAELTEGEVVAACGRAGEVGVGGVVVSPWAVGVAVRAVKGSGLVVGALCGGVGVGKSMVKAIEGSSSVKDGAGVVWCRPRGGLVVGGDWVGVREELMELVRAARAARPGVEVGVDCRWEGQVSWTELGRAVLQGGGDFLVVRAVVAAEVGEAVAGLGVVAEVGSAAEGAERLGAGAVGVVCGDLEVAGQVG